MWGEFEFEGLRGLLRRTAKIVFLQGSACGTSVPKLSLSFAMTIKFMPSTESALPRKGSARSAATEFNLDTIPSERERERSVRRGDTIHDFRTLQLMCYRPGGGLKHAFFFLTAPPPPPPPQILLLQA